MKEPDNRDVRSSTHELVETRIQTKVGQQVPQQKSINKDRIDSQCQFEQRTQK